MTTKAKDDVVQTQLTSEELRIMFEFEEHVPSLNRSDRQKELKDIYENKLFNSELVDMFDVVKNELNRIPSLKEFGVRYVKSSLEYFIKHHRIGKENFEFMLHCFRWRAERTYKSRIYEEYVLMQLQEMYPDFDFIEHPLIDSIFGVDLVVIDDEDYFHYIHITKNTDYAIEKMYKKAQKNHFTIGKKKMTWQRWLKGHIKLLYNANKISDLNKEMMDRKFEKSKSWEIWGENRLQSFCETLIKKEIVDEDFRFVTKKGRVLEKYIEQI